MKLIAGGTRPIERMITHRLGLEGAGQGFAAVCNPVRHDSPKVVLMPHSQPQDA